ncbi:MAG TPA: GNAT family N-acetyltransferase [Gaiellaceae bacterium]|nr:GNAT family N-acetyltransferase [Gaiellaceae bacterium]
MTRKDLTKMLELCQGRWPDVRCTFGVIAFWAAQIGRIGHEVCFFDGAWGYRDGADLEYDGGNVDPALEWAQPGRVIAPWRDEELLGRHGLAHDPNGIWFKTNARTFEGIEEPEVPDGYWLTTMAEYDDLASRAAAHGSAFAPGSRMTVEVYELVRGGWPYRADLDCVCVGPDGHVASYALAWLDERNAVGEFEPVGTHADHRRRGLARATNLFALQRLRAEGARTALVSCRGDDAYPIPRELYASVGFEEIDRKVSFTRATR